MEAYEAAMNRALPIVIGESRTRPGTVEEAVARYFGSTAFAALAATTRQNRRAILERFRVVHGGKRFRKLEGQHVAKLIGRLKPYAQRNMLKTLRALVTFALAEGLIDVDPTVGVKLAGVRDSGGFATWDETHIAQYHATHPLGSRARLALELLFCSMQRRGDVVPIGRQHVRDGALTLRQQKTGTQVDIPVLAELQAAIDAMPRADHLTFLVTDAGKPFTAAGFGNWFREQCNLAGLPKNLSAHGLRKAGATRLAESGASIPEIMAWGGWKTMSEVQRYTEAANRKRMAQQAADKLRARTELANRGARLADPSKKS
jgi:integrase